MDVPEWVLKTMDKYLKDSKKQCHWNDDTYII